MLETINERYKELQSRNGSSLLTPLEQNAFQTFNQEGIPTVRHEEWKYTRISGAFNKDYAFDPHTVPVTVTETELAELRLPGYQNANELVFVNGVFSSPLSKFLSEGLTVQSIEEASGNQFKNIVSEHLGHSSKYIKDGIHALNTAFLQEGIFVHVQRNKVLEHPIYIYNIVDARSQNVLAQPRCLFYVEQNAQLQVVETYQSLGASDSFTNQVMEIVVEQDARVEYYKIQNGHASSSQVDTTHFRQVGKSFIHAVTISLDGGIIRNNLNVAMEAERSEAHLYGLYFVKGNTHVDNHTIVDNAMPHCYSNELYKGIVDDNATAVFNGKIYVREDAQKINAFQSNKNILLSEAATVNTKPQLEIFADDVKCSHGCTVGQLDEEGMFYLRSRGLSEKTARNLLLHAFAINVLEHIKPSAIRDYVDELISGRLEFDAS